MGSNKEVRSLLVSLGMTIPQSTEEIDNHLLDTNESIDPELLDFYKVYSELQTEKKQKVDKILYHKRLVLAAEIIKVLPNDMALGHLKLQKILFFCFNHLQIETISNYNKHRLGPYDPKLMRSIDTQLKKNKWFEYQKNEMPKYTRLEKFGQHSEWYNRYFSELDSDIKLLIRRFRNFKSSHIEVVATVYGVWKNLLNEEVVVNDSRIIEGFYNWDESKSRYSTDQIIKARNWLTANSMEPRQGKNFF